MASYQTRTEPYVSQSFRKPVCKKQESVNKQEIFESWPSFWNEPSHSNLVAIWAFLLIACALRCFKVHAHPAFICQGLLHTFQIGAAGSHVLTHLPYLSTRFHSFFGLVGQILNIVHACERNRSNGWIAARVDISNYPPQMRTLRVDSSKGPTKETLWGSQKLTLMVG